MTTQIIDCKDYLDSAALFDAIIDALQSEVIIEIQRDGKTIFYAVHKYDGLILEEIDA